MPDVEGHAAFAREQRLLAHRAVEEGFTALKSMAVPETGPLEGMQPIRYAEACLKAMRDAVGDAVDLMVDCHARPSPRMGMLFAKALEPFNLYWLEAETRLAFVVERIA